MRNRLCRVCCLSLRFSASLHLWQRYLPRAYGFLPQSRQRPSLCHFERCRRILSAPHLRQRECFAGTPHLKHFLILRNSRGDRIRTCDTSWTQARRSYQLSYTPEIQVGLLTTVRISAEDGDFRDRLRRQSSSPQSRMSRGDARSGHWPRSALPILTQRRHGAGSSDDLPPCHFQPSAGLSRQQAYL